MARLEQLVEEIKELKREQNHKTALRIFSILTNNKKLFLEKMDSDVMELILKNYERMSYGSPSDHGTSAYKRDFENYYENLLFHLNKIF